MAKYQRNLALSLVRIRSKQRPPATAAGMDTVAEGRAEEPDETRGAAAAAASSNSSLSSSPPPLLRGEIAGLRGTTQEGRRLEDWHPESLVALWCTSLMVDHGGSRGPGWERGRERSLSVLHWISRDAGPESGGVMAGTVVPFLAHGGGGGGDSPRAPSAEGDLRKLKACFASYLEYRLEDEQAAAAEGQEQVPSGHGYGHGGFTSSFHPSVRRLPHASTRHFVKSGGTAGRATTPASARHVADTAAAAGVPRRLLSLSGAELSALSALLDVVLGHDGNSSNPSVTPLSAARSTGAAAGDTAAALFAKPRPPAAAAGGPSPPLPGFGSGRKVMPTAVIAATSDMDDYASVFLLAQGLRARLVERGAGGGGGTGGSTKAGEAGIAPSAALAMLLAPNGTQKEVLEILCPKSGGGVAAPGAGLAWGDASAMLLPLWVRDASELQRVAESVASATFLQDRDLMAVRGSCLDRPGCVAGHL